MNSSKISLILTEFWVECYFDGVAFRGFLRIPRVLLALLVLLVVPLVPVVLVLLVNVLS